MTAAPLRTAASRHDAPADEAARPLRLLFDARIVVNQTTGLGRYVDGLLGAFAALEQPLDVRVLVHDELSRDHTIFSLPERAIWPARFTIESVPVPGVDPRQHLAMRTYLKRWPCDLYHYPHYDLPSLSPHRNIITVHDLKFLRFPHLLASRARAVYVQAALRLAVRRAERILVVSESTRDDLVQQLGVPADRIDPVHIAPAPLCDPDATRLAALHLEPGFLLCVAERRKHKNVAGLIRAYDALRRVRQRVPPLVIVGHRYRDYDEPERLVAELQLREHVRFVDGATDATLSALYHHARMFVLPSLYEGFGIPILEAMRAGVPVITSDVSSMPEVAGGAALLVDPQSPESITRAMCELLDDPRLGADLAMRGRRRADQFSWTETARRTLGSRRRLIRCLPKDTVKTRRIPWRADISEAIGSTKAPDGFPNAPLRWFRVKVYQDHIPDGGRHKMARTAILSDYWRSSASYRVRIALNLLDIPTTLKPVNLLTGDHQSDSYLAQNPQGLLPTLEIDGKALTQSLAIIEYLHATTTGSSLLPDDVDGQFRVRQLSYAIAMEIHPVCNLSVAQHVLELTGGDNDTRADWMRHFIQKGLGSFEQLLQTTGGPFCFGARPTMADCCLIPQLYNADRWGADISGFARTQEAARAAQDLQAFQDAHPDAVGPPPP